MDELWGDLRGFVAARDYSSAWALACSCPSSEHREAMEAYVWRSASDVAARRAISCAEMAICRPSSPHPSWRVPHVSVGHDVYVLSCGAFTLRAWYALGSFYFGVYHDHNHDHKRLGEGQGRSLEHAQLLAQECLRELVLPALGVF